MTDQGGNKGAFVPQERIEHLLDTAEVETFHRVFGKLTIVVAQVENGFTLVGSSGCVNPDNYDEELGEEICINQIADQLWKLEGYALSERVHREGR